MSNFIDFKNAVQKQFEILVDGDLFTTNVSKDDLWDTYLNSFPEGTNPIFKERTEHDCQCCKQFIRACANVISLKNGEKMSIWDVELEGEYGVVAKALSNLVKNAEIAKVFYHYEKNLGTDFNEQVLPGSKLNERIKWDHFYHQLPQKFVMPKDSISSKQGSQRSSKDVFERALEEISLDSINTVLELIEQNSLYRGEEHQLVVEAFLKHKRAYNLLETEGKKEFYAWEKSIQDVGASRIRNTVIGTLMVDISDGVELDRAVASFESKVAPTSYKRPTAVITKSMITNAQKKTKELGVEDSLQRQYAVQDDITINNVLFANRDVKKSMDVFDELSDQAPAKIGNLDKVEEIDIETFIKTILPKSESIELMFESNQVNNLVSLIAPVNQESKPIFKWDNNFSWSYNGNVADSMKERVKKAGGNIEGVLRFSIQWNDGDNNQNDFDAHCREPDGNLIYFSSKTSRKTQGSLDVDITHPGRNIAVENITWANKDKLLEGEYEFLVHNYSHKGGMTGFTAEIEYEGKIYSYTYNKGLNNNEKVQVAKIKFSKKNGISFIKSLPNSQATKEVWGISTNNFHKVSMIMHSPNHWDGNETGNKHWLFMLEGCNNNETSRGFYNEFLSNELNEHRKVFEVLGNKMKVPVSDNQLSGLGFSSTVRKSVLCKITGSFSRVIKIKF